MKKDNSFHDYVVYDLLADIPGILSRAMFGGWGIYKDGVIFAIIVDGQLYFKVGDCNRKDYEKYESESFVYIKGNGKKVSMSYMLLPEEIMENREEIYLWVEAAVDVSNN